MKFKDVEKRVRVILTEKPITRDDDDLLYLAYISATCTPADVSIEDFFSNRTKYAPPFESVRRTRQKLQEENEDLRGTKMKERYLKEQEVLKWVREHGREKNVCENNSFK